MEMDMQQINLQQRNIQAAPLQDMEQHNLQAAPLQNMLEHNLQVQGRMERNEHLNGAAGAIEWENNQAQMQPVALPQHLQAQEVAAMTKQEKRLLRQRQQEEQRQAEEERLRQEEARRQAEEEQRRRREEEIRALREERLRRDEEERQEKRKLLLEDDITLNVMEKMAQEKDETLLQERMKLFLRVAAERLLELRPELKDAYRRTVSYVPVAESLKLIAAEHALNQEQMDLVEKANQRMKALEEMNHENVVMRVIEFELSDIFKEEYKALAGMKKASNAIMEEYQKEDQRQIKKLDDLGQEAAEAFHLKSEDGKKVNVLEKGSPFAYLGKKEELEKYHAQVQRVMEQQHCTKKEAEEQVIRERRRIREEKALEKTMQGSVVPNVSVEEWKRNGGASFHHILPAGEALQVVEDSHGYLYAKDVGDGLMELHHTIPETIELTINGEKKEYPLRRNYNLLIKCIAAQMVDENGNMYRDKEKVDHMWDLYDKLARAASKVRIDSGFVDVLLKSMRVLFENEQKAINETINMCEFFKDMMKASKTDNFILPLEIVKNYGNFIQMFGSAGDTSYNLHIEKLRKELLTDPNRTETEEEIELILKQIPNVSLTEQKAQLVERMESEGCSQEMIYKYVNALASFHADMDATAMDLLDIRNMDIHTKDVPLPNACSANAVFYDNLSQLRGKNMEIMLYETESHAQERPREELEYILANLQNSKKFKENEEKLKEIERRCLDVNYEVTEEEQMIISDTASSEYKYSYHQAAQVGTSADGTVTTCETFAAETTQAMVSPFIRKSAVGRYKGRVWYKETKYVQDMKELCGSNIKINDGMKGYYNHDNPFPADDDIRAELKEDFLKNSIEGIVEYARKNKNSL